MIEFAKRLRDTKPATEALGEDALPKLNPSKTFSTKAFLITDVRLQSNAMNVLCKLKDDSIYIRSYTVSVSSFNLRSRAVILSEEEKCALPKQYTEEPVGVLSRIYDGPTIKYGCTKCSRKR